MEKHFTSELTLYLGSRSDSRFFFKKADELITMVILFFLFGVSAKHRIDEDSTTVSQKETTGSATWNIKIWISMNNSNKKKMKEELYDRRGDRITLQKEKRSMRKDITLTSTSE